MVLGTSGCKTKNRTIQSNCRILHSDWFIWSTLLQTEVIEVVRTWLQNGPAGETKPHTMLELSRS